MCPGLLGWAPYLGRARRMAYYQKRVADLTVKVATATSTESRQWAERQLAGATAMLAQREREAGAAEAGREDEGTDAEVSATAGNNWR